MTGRQFLFSLFSYTLWMTICPSAWADQAQFGLKIDPDSLVEIIKDAEGEEKLNSILLYCQKFTNSNPKGSKDYSRLGVELAKQRKNSLQENNLKLFQAKAGIRLGELDSAKSLLNQVIHWGQLEKDSLILGKAHSIYGMYYYIKGDFPNSFVQNQQAIEIAEEIDNPRLLFDATSYMAHSHLVLAQHDQAIALYDVLLKLCEKHSFDCTGTILNKASALNYIGKQEQALDLFFQVRSTFREKEDPYGTAVTEHHIGFLLKDIDLYKEALQFYLSVEQFFQQNGDVYYLSHIKMSLGEVMLKLGRLDEAEAYLRESIRLKEEKGMQNLSDHFAYMGDVALARDSIERAISFFKEALDYSQKFENYSDIAVVYNCLSSAYLQKGELETSISYAQKSLASKNDNPDWDQMELAYENIFNAYLQLGKSEEAIGAKNQLDEVKEQMLGPEELMEITRKVVLETLEVNKPINQNQTSNTPRLLKTSPHLWKFWLALIALVSIFVLYFLLKKNPPTSPKKAGDGKPLSTVIHSPEVEELLKRLDSVMKEGKPYLKATLTLRELADQTQTTDKKLSHVLNQALGTNFYDYLNRYRVEAFQEKWKSGEFNNYSIVGLAELCGFSSKSSFYRAFKKEKGISPSEFMKRN